jgi:hypothetical protein
MPRTIIKERFKSLTNLIDTMEERPLNAAFKGLNDIPSSQRDESEKKEKGRASWSGSYTYEETKETLRSGYKDPLDKLKKAVLKTGQKDNYQRPRTHNDFVGFAAHVPNTLMGLPQTMINRPKSQAKAKTIHLLYSFCAASTTTTDDLIKGGVNFISLANSLEKQGYRVKIDVIFTTMESKTAASFTVNLKEYGQHMNLLKLAYPLVHPGMLRRLAFKWLETTPSLKDKSFIHGYGQPLNFAMGNNIEREREFLAENEIIGKENTFYCNVYQAIKAKDLNDLAKAMKIIK